MFHRKKQFNLLIALFVFLLSCCFSANVYAFDFFSDLSAQQQKADDPVEAIADQLEYQKGANKIIGRGNAVVSYQDMRLTCDYAEVDTVKKTVYAKGHVVMYRGDDVLRGEECHYDFISNTGSFPGGAFKNTPFYGSGESIEQISKDEFVLNGGKVTTCEHILKPGEHLHYEITAKKIHVFPKEKLIAYNVQLRVLGKPVMWLPYIHIPLKDGHSPLHVQPGYSSENGFYLLSAKRFSVNENIKGKAHLDYRSKRGVGGGADFDYEFDSIGSGIMKIYATEDERSPDQKSSEPYDNRVDKSRYRVTLKHKKKFSPSTTLMGEYNNFGDRYFLKDFFSREYDEETDPDTFVTLTHNKNNYGFFVNVDKRINHFVDKIEKLPEVRFNWNNQELGNSGIYYKNETSAVNFHRKRAQSDLDDDVFRFDTVHEVSYPTKFSIFSMKPYMNWRGNWYSKNRQGEESLTRQVIGGGFDVNTKFFRIFDVTTDFLNLNINKLRHVIEPSFKYSFVRHRSVLPSELMNIDSIDTIDDYDKLRLGFDNRLQTKRLFGEDEKTVNLVSYDTYVTYNFNNKVTKVNGDVQDGSSFVTWDNEVAFRPFSWLLAKGDFKYSFPNDEFSEANLDLEVRNKDKWHAYLQQKFLKSGSKQITIDGSYKINDMWGIGGYARVEFDEDAYTEEWELRASRDMHCWFLDLGYNVRNSDIDSSNKEVFVQLTLKAFPQYPMKSGGHATFSRSRIGATVSGSAEPEATSYEAIRY